ncbi:AlpA family transcriptional regulator [Thiothrix lacustris]|uniref:AlpA family transcriptional regulator n=1 Tax=Thiothrix lacustris TaxID=525917 RepID=A0ABY9MQJ8_9GAMM|nr:AlpA family transcriptional regulator [Thiothrix lacustris]WML90857.1 AlpA family transcriptional regulator [Thiothrix lacustris]
MEDHTKVTPELQVINERLIRLPEVIQMTGISRTTVYEYIKRGTFPKSYRLATRLTAWKLSEITAWIDSRRHVGGAV